MIRTLDEKAVRILARSYPQLLLALKSYPIEENNSYYSEVKGNKNEYFIIVSPSALEKPKYEVLINQKSKHFHKIDTILQDDEISVAKSIRKFNERFSYRSPSL